MAVVGSPGESTDEASPAALRRRTSEAQDLLLAEREGVLRRHLTEAHDAGSAHPCAGRAWAVAAVGKPAKSAENKINSSARLGLSLASHSKSLASIGPTSPRFDL